MPYKVLALLFISDTQMEILWRYFSYPLPELTCVVNLGRYLSPAYALPFLPFYKSQTLPATLRRMLPD